MLAVFVIKRVVLKGKIYGDFFLDEAPTAQTSIKTLKKSFYVFISTQKLNEKLCDHKVTSCVCTGGKKIGRGMKRTLIFMLLFRNADLNINQILVKVILKLVQKN